MSDELTTLLVIFFSHWVGDYLFQTTPMALRKGTSLYWLSLHVLVYTGTILVFSAFVLGGMSALKFGMMSGALHWIVDFFTSRIAPRVIHRPRVYYPLIGFDQFLHIASLLITLAWFQ
jgi:hypothetical protein